MKQKRRDTRPRDILAAYYSTALRPVCKGPYRYNTMNIPDVLDLICQLSTVPTCLSIALSSCHFFHVAIPYVWRESAGLDHLFSLIPGLNLCYSRHPKQETLGFPNNGPPDLSRFNIYSRLVRSLQVHPTAFYTFNLESWDGFLRYSESLGHSLLPNLRRLIVNNEACLNVDRMNWVAVFLCPSLREIQVPVQPEANPLWILNPAASMLLALVTKRCPLLQALTIFPRPAREEDEGGGPDVLPASSLLAPYTHISALQNLRTLTIGKHALQPDALTCLGALPKLETLTVHESLRDYGPVKCDGNLPVSLFPSLRSLTLHLIDSYELARIWRVDALVRHLKQVDIRTVLPELEYAQEVGKFGLADWLPELFKNSLHINWLSVGYETDYEPPQLLASTSLCSVFLLPLRSLSLVMIEIEDIDTFYEKLSQSCPDLRSLRVPNHPLKIPDLPRCTHHLKNLEQLCVNVQWINLPEDPELFWQSSNHLVSLECHKSENDPDVEPSAIDIVA
ncbi:fanconi anemia group M protein [Ceratobasidium sp. AG-Ba]|nr:fanconi anemia group M protein [Ceratobasidium sp. AG-Ba]